MSKTKVKPHTYKRWLNQILYSIKYLHSNDISIFQGNISSETIFIQNSGVIKLAPTLLTINGICEVNHDTIKCNKIMNKKNCSIDLIKLNDETMINDLHAIGRIAIEIFTSHVKLQSPSSPRPKSYRLFIKQSSTNIDDNFLYLNDCYNYLEDDMQIDFLNKIFNIGKDKKITIETIWFHPFINIIDSLKVLSVFSLLNYFQNNSKFNLDKIRKNSAQNADIKNLNCNLNKSGSNPRIILNDLPSNRNNSILSIKSNRNKSESSLSSSNLKLDSNNMNNSLNDGNTNKNGSTNSLNDLNTSINSNLASLINNNKNHFTKQFYRTNSTNRIAKSSSCNQLKINNSNYSERRKVSLSFLTNCNHLNIPQHFFGILEDIRSGLHPRLFKDTQEYSLSNSNLKDLSSSSCLDFVIQHKQILDRRSSISAFNSNNINGAVNPGESFALSNSNNNNSSSNINTINNNSRSTLIRVNSNDLDINNDNENKINNNINISQNLVKHPIETRRLISESCYINNIEKNESMIQLNLTINFNDNSTCRMLKCYFPQDILNYFKEHSDLNNNDNMSNIPFLIYNPLENKIENICKHLTNELIDFGLINFRDHNLIADLLLKTIKDYVVSIMKKV